MKIVRQSEARAQKNSEACTAWEYVFDGEASLNSARIELDGRYPEQGYTLNTESKMLIYATSGAGVIVTAKGLNVLRLGDMVLVAPNEKYYFLGKLEMLISSAPAWRPDQYENVPDAASVRITYTNWKRETAVREIEPMNVWHGSTEWHPQEQWFLRARDVGKVAVRDFALSDIHE